MSIYENKILPIVLDTLCSHKSVISMREKVVPRATGVVLEVGMGSAINLHLYDKDKVKYIWGLEPSRAMREKAKRNLDKSDLEVRWLDLPGEEVPLEDESIDTVLLTYTLCTIPDWKLALKQMYRVLKPEGKLLFCEHGLSPEKEVSALQNRVNPIWKKMVGGCHLNRNIKELISESGFHIEKIENCYMEIFPKITGYMYIGEASKSSYSA